jgi:hypothetical protein
MRPVVCARARYWVWFLVDTNVSDEHCLGDQPHGDHPRALGARRSWWDI